MPYVMSVLHVMVLTVQQKNSSSRKSYGEKTIYEAAYHSSLSLSVSVYTMQKSRD